MHARHTWNAILRNGMHAIAVIFLFQISPLQLCDVAYHWLQFKGM